ncbi:MAG: hypothetical protein RIF32_17570 [Leptospirales bacterium]|jgi:hypothetical protein
MNRIILFRAAATIAVCLSLALPSVLSAQTCPAAILQVPCNTVGSSDCLPYRTFTPAIPGFNWQGIGCLWQGQFSVAVERIPNIAPNCSVSQRLGIVTMNQQTFSGTTRVYPVFIGYSTNTVPYTGQRYNVCSYSVTTSGPFP